MKTKQYFVWLPALALAARMMLAAAAIAQAQTSADQVVDLSAVPQIHETAAQRDARMQWFRDAKFGMFIHWGPCSVGQKEIGWGRNANRPWDINKQGPRTSDPVYDNYYKQFNPVKYNADGWVRFAKESGMKYMVLISKHHDGFAQFATELSDYNIMSSPYRKDIVKQFVEACHKHGMKAGLYYSTRDWYNADRRHDRTTSGPLCRSSRAVPGPARDTRRRISRCRRRDNRRCTSRASSSRGPPSCRACGRPRQTASQCPCRRATT